MIASRHPRHRFNSPEARTARRMQMRQQLLQLARHTHPLPCPFCNLTLDRPQRRRPGICATCGTAIPTESLIPPCANRIRRNAADQLDQEGGE